LAGATAGLAALPAAAQDWYGSVGLSFQFNDVTNGIGAPAVGFDTNEPRQFAQDQLDASVGALFHNGAYAQLDLRAIDTDVPAATNDTLHRGALVALRGGRRFGSFDMGAFAGYVDVTGDDTAGNNKMTRLIGGIEGRYHASPDLSLFAELGSIGSANGTQGTGGDDGIYDAAYLIAGASYRVSPRLSVEGSLGYADGTNDQDPVRIKSATVGLVYDFDAPGWSGYARADYSDYLQSEGGGNGIYVKTLQLGLTYRIGAQRSSARSLRRLAPYEDWLGYTGGHLE